MFSLFDSFSLGDLFFSEEEMEEEWIWERGDMGGALRSEGRGNSNPDAIYKRRILKKKKIVKTFLQKCKQEMI